MIFHNTNEMKIIKINFCLVIVTFLNFNNNILMAQNIPAYVRNIIEHSLVKDSNNRYADLVRNKTYFAHKIQSVFYTSVPNTIYSFGDGSSHGGHNYLIIVTNDTMNATYSIIGNEESLLESLNKLQHILTEIESIESKNVITCYSLMIQNFENSGIKRGTKRR